MESMPTHSGIRNNVRLVPYRKAFCRHFVALQAASRPGSLRLQNWHGVILELRGRRGAKSSVDLNGLQISLR